MYAAASWLSFRLQEAAKAAPLSNAALCDLTHESPPGRGRVQAPPSLRKARSQARAATAFATPIEAGRRFAQARLRGGFVAPCGSIADETSFVDSVIGRRSD